MLHPLPIWTILTILIFILVNSVQAYYEEERLKLLKNNMDTLRLIKFILNDNPDPFRKGEHIGYIHAMRSASGSNNLADPNDLSQRTRPKPYQLKEKPKPKP